MPEKTDQKFELQADRTAAQGRLPLKPAEPGARAERRRKDSARLVWDSKPKRPPSPRDIEFQTAEVVIPNPARDAGTPPLRLARRNSPPAKAHRPGRVRLP